jgi:hypothetical protein
MASPVLAIPLDNMYLRRGVFLATIFLFWRWVGSGLDRRAGALVQQDEVPSRARVGFWGVGATAALVVAGLGIWTFVDPGGMSFLVPAATIAWSLYFVWYFGRKLQKHRQSHQQQSAVR